MFQKNITLARAPTFSENPTELPSAGAWLFRFVLPIYASPYGDSVLDCRNYNFEVQVLKDLVWVTICSSS